MCNITNVALRNLQLTTNMLGTTTAAINLLHIQQEIKRVGRKFANTVLALGGGSHPSKVFKEFRGRDPTPDALLRHSGLVGAAV
jgi:Zn-dependent oligopeptidase